MRKFLLLSTALLLLPAALAYGADKSAKPACPELSKEDKTQLEMIGKVLADGKAYAALAFLDAARLDVVQAKLYRANALRQTGQYDLAQAEYQQLTSSCLGGFAYQGLGLLAEIQEQHEAATAYLKTATGLLPVDSRVRSDYGYALMMYGDTQLALNQFLTAIELDGNNHLAKHNLVMLMYKTGQLARAEELAREFKFSDAQLREIRAATGVESAPNEYYSSPEEPHTRVEQPVGEEVVLNAAPAQEIIENELTPEDESTAQEQTAQHEVTIEHDVELEAGQDAEPVQATASEVKKTTPQVISGCYGTSNICTGILSPSLDLGVESGEQTQ